jgi:hypothetical protein
VPLILTTWKADIRRIVVQDQPRQKVHKTSFGDVNGKILGVFDPSYDMKNKIGCHGTGWPEPTVGPYLQNNQSICLASMKP